MVTNKMVSELWPEGNQEFDDIIICFKNMFSTTSTFQQICRCGKITNVHRRRQISAAKFGEIHLRKENKSLLHFQRIANHLENMNSEEANKRVDYLHQLQKYAEILVFRLNFPHNCQSCSNVTKSSKSSKCKGTMMGNRKHDENYAVTFLWGVWLGYDVCCFVLINPTHILDAPFSVPFDISMFQDLVPAFMFLGLKMLNVVLGVAWWCLLEDFAPTFILFKARLSSATTTTTKTTTTTCV